MAEFMFPNVCCCCCYISSMAFGMAKSPKETNNMSPCPPDLPRALECNENKTNERFLIYAATMLLIARAMIAVSLVEYWLCGSNFRPNRW